MEQRFLFNGVGIAYNIGTTTLLTGDTTVLPGGISLTATSSYGVQTNFQLWRASASTNWYNTLNTDNNGTQALTNPALCTYVATQPLYFHTLRMQAYPTTLTNTPREFVFEASNDGLLWVTLASATQTSWLANTDYNYKCIAPRGFFQYRLRVLSLNRADTNAKSLILQKIHLLGI